jgi:RNA-directed DNA polymerase
MRGISMRENREVPWLPGGDGTTGRIGKAGGREPMMNGQGTSDWPAVPTKPPNRAGESATEVVEGRGRAKGKTGQQNAPRTQSRVGAPSALDRVREVARRDRKTRFTALFHHLTTDRLRDAFFSLKKEAAPGVDGVKWEHAEAAGRPRGHAGDLVAHSADGQGESGWVYTRIQGR